MLFFFPFFFSFLQAAHISTPQHTDKLKMSSPEPIADEESPLLVPAVATPDNAPTVQELPLAKLIAVLLCVWVSPPPDPIERCELS